MFPESQDSPSVLLQDSLHLAISFSVAFDLIEPILLIRFEGSLGFVSPPIAVPELTIAKDCNPRRDEYEVWLSHDSVLFPVTKSSLPESGSKSFFDRRSTRANARHRVMNLFTRRFHAAAQLFRRSLHSALPLGCLHRRIQKVRNFSSDRRDIMRQNLFRRMQISFGHRGFRTTLARDDQT